MQMDFIKNNKKHFLLIVRVVISLSILAFLVHLSRGSSGQVFSKANLIWVFLAAMVFALETVFLSLRWRLINNIFMKNWEGSMPENFSNGWYFKTAYESLALSQCLPTSFGGDAWRIAKTKPLFSSLGMSAFTVFFDRFTGLLMLGLLMLMSLPFVWETLPVTLKSFFTICFVIGFIGLGVLAILLIFKSKIFNLSLFKSNLAQRLRLSFELLKTPSLGDWGIILSMAAIIHTMTALALMLVGVASGYELSFMQGIFASACGLIFAILPVTFGGWGLREGTIAFALGFFGIASEQAIDISLSFGLALLISTFPGALMFLISRNK